MDYTDFSKVLDIVKELEAKELKSAVAAAGGRVEFDEDYCPAVAAYVDDWSPGPADVQIKAVEIRNGRLEFEALDMEYDVIEGLSAKDFFPGQISYITSSVPKTGRTRSVAAGYGVLADAVRQAQDKLLDSNRRLGIETDSAGRTAEIEEGRPKGIRK